MNPFPKNFTWGAAAASYQIEGAATEDGRGLSVWDMFCRQPGRVFAGQTGDVACDHYHRYKEDVALMREIGLKAYRFSVSWPRVIPEGTGKVNAKGLAFYDKLVDALLAAGIEPWVTLFHWDYPYELYCRGGWLSPDSPQWFADYTQVVVDRLSDRVTHWFTHNEPQCFIGLGLQQGVHAPGDRLGAHELARASHHTLLAHGRAVQVIRACAKKTPVVGWAPVGGMFVPADPNNPADVETARRNMFSNAPRKMPQSTPSPISSVSWWSDPVFLGAYPEDALQFLGSAAPKIRNGDMETISQPLDFYGINIYGGMTVSAANPENEKVRLPDGAPVTAFKWDVVPSSLYWGPKFLYERYKTPVIITENGLSGADWVSLDGRVPDGHRIDFLHRYLRELGRAIADGVDVRGYFQWSIMDNFEWAEGYKERFGLIHVDYATQKRTLKDSAHWYSKVIASNGLNLF